MATVLKEREEDSLFGWVNFMVEEARSGDALRKSFGTEEQKSRFISTYY